MRIGIVTAWFESGAGYVSRQYFQKLREKHQVFIYARGEEYEKGNPEWNLSNVTWDKKDIHAEYYPTGLNLRYFQDWIEKNQLDLVFFNEQNWLEPVILCAKLGVKTGAYVDYYTEVTVPFFGIYDFLICNTRRHHSAFDWHPQAYYVPWGTDINLFKPKNINPVNPGFVTFFHSAGFIPPRRGTDLVINAFNYLRGPVKLVLHAQIDLKKYYPSLRGVISDLEDKGKLQCYEKTVGAPGLFHLGDVYVYPSRLDGIGLTIAEALACGLPVITSDHPPMNEFIDETSGKVVSIDRFFSRADGYYWPQCLVNLKSLTVAMQDYVNDLNHLLQKKQAAREYAVNKLNWMMNAEQITELFESARKIAIGKKIKVIKDYFSSERIPFILKFYKKYPAIAGILRKIYKLGKKGNS